MDTADKVSYFFLFMMGMGFGWAVMLLFSEQGWRLLAVVVGMVILAGAAYHEYLIITCPPEQDNEVEEEY